MEFHKCVCFITLYMFIIICATKNEQVFVEDEETLNKRFQQLQKPKVKTIQNEYGDIYDCVDFYKQPAFDHPLLKHHKFHPQMRPSFVPKTTSFASNNISDSIKLKNGGCPIGYVPIRRVSKDDFFRISRFTKDYAKSSADEVKPGTHFAILRTNSNPSEVKYYGVSGELNVYNMSIGPFDYTGGEIIIQNGDDKIKVGWMINPTVNKDARIHMFQYLDAGQSHCFNTLCPGFVSVSKEVPIDAPYYGESHRGKNRHFTKFYIYQDVKDGHWWLKTFETIVGFWPQQIFTAMKTGSTYISVGGEAYSPPDHPLPPMGNGYYPTEDVYYSAYCLDIEVLDANRQSIDPQQTETYTDDSHYGVYDGGKQGTYGRVMYYGGTTLW